MAVSRSKQAVPALFGARIQVRDLESPLRDERRRLYAFTVLVDVNSGQPGPPDLQARFARHAEPRVKVAKVMPRYGPGAPADWPPFPVATYRRHRYKEVLCEDGTRYCERCAASY